MQEMSNSIRIRQTFGSRPRTVAEQHGLLATFMPKPFSNLTGNGAHVHLSLADVSTGKNLFQDSSAELGLSPLGKWFMGGVLHHARALSALVAPLVNSYKRLVRGASALGSDLGSRLHHVWRVQSHPDDPCSRFGPV